MPTQTLNARKRHRPSTLHAWAAIPPPWCRFLARPGTNPNGANQDGLTPLHIICQPDFLHSQSYCRHTTVIRLLVHVNQHDNNDSTPLHFACKNGLCKIVKVLLELGADVRLRDQLGRTVIFDILECLRRRRCLAMLAAITARCTAQNPLDVLNISDHEGRAPIHDVSESGDCLVARRLHSAGADMNLRDGVGMLLLHHAANGNVGNRGSVSADASSAGSWHQAAGTALYVFYHRPAGDTSNNSFKLRR